MTIAKKLQLFSGQTPPRSTSVEGKGRQGKAREGKGREGKARQGKAREGKARPAPCRSSAADKRGKTFLPAPATKPQTTEQKRKRVSREKPTSPPATHSIFSTAKKASCGTSTFPT